MSVYPGVMEGLKAGADSTGNLAQPLRSHMILGKSFNLSEL